MSKSPNVVEIFQLKSDKNCHASTPDSVTTKVLVRKKSKGFSPWSSPIERLSRKRYRSGQQDTSSNDSASIPCSSSSLSAATQREDVFRLKTKVTTLDEIHKARNVLCSSEAEDNIGEIDEDDNTGKDVEETSCCGLFPACNCCRKKRRERKYAPGTCKSSAREYPCPWLAPYLPSSVHRVLAFISKIYWRLLQSVLGFESPYGVVVAKV